MTLPKTPTFVRTVTAIVVLGLAKKQLDAVTAKLAEEPTAKPALRDWQRLAKIQMRSRSDSRRSAP